MPRLYDNQLSGKEVENWFKSFAKQESITSNINFTLKQSLDLLNQKLNKRLNDGLIYSPKLQEYRDIINQFLVGHKPQLSTQVEKDIQEKVLDYVIATDAVISLNNRNGQPLVIAIDITANPTKEKEKLDRVRGLPELSDKPGKNRNKNLPAIRRQLGIDKHLILVLSNQKSLLPNRSKLLNKLQAFAEGKATTASVNLTNLEHKDTLGYTSHTPQQIYQSLSTSVNTKDAPTRISAIARGSLELGYDIEFTTSMVQLDPIFKNFKDPESSALTLALNTQQDILKTRLFCATQMQDLSLSEEEFTTLLMTINEIMLEDPKTLMELTEKTDFLSLITDNRELLEKSSLTETIDEGSFLSLLEKLGFEFEAEQENEL